MLLSILLIGVTLSIDSAFVGITYGVRGTKIPFYSFAVILIFSILYAGISIFFGHCLRNLLDTQIIKIIGALILAALGVNMIVNSFKTVKAEKAKKRGCEFIKLIDMSVQVYENPSVGDTDNSGIIDAKEAFFLTLALSADSLVAGIAGGMLSFSVWLFPVVTGVFQALFLCLGIHLGNIFKEKIKLHDNYISVIAGITIIVFSIIKLM